MCAAIEPTASTLDFQKLAEHISSPTWNHTPERLGQLADEIIESEKAVLDQIAAVESPTLENVLKPYVRIFHANAFKESQVFFYLAVSANKELRDAASEGEKRLDKHSIDCGLRVDVFQVFKKLEQTTKSEDLDPETKRFLDKTLLGFRRNGLELSEDKRNLYQKYSLEISELAIKFGKNMNEQTEHLFFTKEELEGVPQDVVDGFEVVDGKYKMTYKYPDVLPVMKYAQNQETRKRAYLGNQSKVSENGKLILEIIKLRYKKAKLLGYENFSDYVLEERLAKNLSNVLSFLNDLKEKLTPLGKQDLQVLKTLKNKDLESKGLPIQEELYQWDVSFYENILLQQEYQVDHQEIQKYFPLDSTISKMLGFYEKLFDIKFHQVKGLAELVWHEDVKQFAVFKNIALGSPSIVGYIYFDLHPREGKYGHAANFGLGPGYLKEDGTRQFPVTALVCNFTKPTKEKPSLLKHDEVTTFFHELGHGVHSLLAETKYAKFHGTSVPRDFVEAPSQMLEFWTWSKNELRALSSHYETGKPISDELIDQLIKSKHVLNGLSNLRQLHFGLFDMHCHTINNDEDLEKLDLLQTWNTMRQSITQLSTNNEFTPGYASFGHIAHGYESGYYGYLYSQVFAVDIFYTLFKEDPMNVKSGLRYRDIILGRGNSREMLDNLEELLGRKPNSEAFLQELLG